MVTVYLPAPVTTPADAVARTAEKILVRLQRAVDDHSRRPLRLARRHRPVVPIPAPRRVVLVTRRDDVLAVLADPDTFALPFQPRLQGRFLLGVTGGDLARDRAELLAVMRADDLEFLRGLAESEAERRVPGADGALDVGTDLVHPVLDAVVGRYLGVPGPDPATQLRWARDLFQYIFLPEGGLPTVRRRAQRAKWEMGAHVDRLVAARRAATGGPDDVLGRMLDRQRVAPATAFDDGEIRDYLVGLAIGWLWHGAKAPMIAVDELLDRPDALAEARSAAQARDLDRLRHVLWEALRFRPVQAGVPRVCTRDTVLAPGTGRARRLRKDTMVIAGTHSAMWDEEWVPDPERFDWTRAEGQYLIFGDGLHRCFGEDIMRRQLPAMLAPLLRAGNLRRADGPPGLLRWQGPAPDALRVEFTR